MREHARALAHRLDPEQERDAAIARLLDYYQHTAAAADARIIRRTRPGRVADDGGPAAVPALADGRAPGAEAMLRQALGIFQRIGAAEAPGLLAELNAQQSSS